MFAFSRFSGFLLNSAGRKGIQETRESRAKASSERFAIGGGERERIQSRKQARDNKSSDIHDEVLNYRLQSSERIKQVQTALRKAGYYDGEIDGKPGPLTKRSVKEFQKARKLTSDGIVGERTWKALGQYLKD